IPIVIAVLVSGTLVIKVITLPPEVKTAKLVEIPEGANAVDVAKLLQEKGIIKNDDWFLYLTKRYNVQEKLQAGIYEFSGRTPLKEVIKKLSHGDVILVRVTVPEGSTVKDIADILEKKELVSKEEFIEYALETKKLEGMLFPDTYLFPHKTSVEAIASTMYKRFRQVFEEVYGEPVTDTNFQKVKEIVTVASIVEKEAGYDSERRIIAGIIYKRLKKNMPIQSCATVIYATGKQKSRLSTSDLKVRSPYNTYIHRGLPPGPICNPGLSSLKAAINPAKTDYLYFVSMGDGRNYFSKTYTEHLTAIKSFLSSDTTTPDTSVK
ncbi:MAG: endolytic transglycosylase MltG, partial [Candidatus Ratteibacteria bacterium]|nr:endolytic transglycosylase MltG [Candidatus Ratteibacteria bacterium]